MGKGGRRCRGVLVRVVERRRGTGCCRRREGNRAGQLIAESSDFIECVARVRVKWRLSPYAAVRALRRTIFPLNYAFHACKQMPLLFLHKLLSPTCCNTCASHLLRCRCASLQCAVFLL
ncbi:unnamed protein product [Chondrus crispus]|uniref:Uncharacterized protein n=1 Tax=Chondrus crispus TaxID=2769 RepID=R7QSW0_CHOCR|nr:unnamed protein product [Chondrus crispus]CDF40596.1 unnamed protein product [Chondrus crispus]|eukprot:XP_005710890.1 unnamed protein product [Chondrus crispus]